MFQYKKRIKDFINQLSERVKIVYGERLITFAVFGSVARNTFRPDSDIDCFIVSCDLPLGRIKRVSEFQTHVEDFLIPAMDSLRQKGIFVNISPIFKTVEEVEQGSPLFLDMVYDLIILFDKENYFKNYLKKLKKRLERLGSKRVIRGNAWYWILKPDYKYGDIIKL